MRAVHVMLAAAALLMSAHVHAQSSGSPRPGTPRSRQAPRPPARKPPPKGAKPKTSTTPGGVVRRETPAITFRGPIFNENANAVNDLTEALMAAKAENRRVLIHWGSNDSAGCRALHMLLLNDPTLRRLLLYEYRLVLIDVSSRTRNQDMALSYGVGSQGAGLPGLTVLDAEGEVICNQQASKFGDGRGGFDPAKLAEFLRGYQVMYPAADDLVQKALAAARAARTPLLVQFASPSCPRCNEIDKWFERIDVEGVLQRHVARVRIDVDRTVGGRDVLRRYSNAWQTAIPWFVLLDPTGSEEGTILSTSDCLDGRSIATLADDESIARFQAILQTNASGLTDAELEWLSQSLRQLNPPPAAAKAPADASPTKPESPGPSESGAAPPAQAGASS